MRYLFLSCAALAGVLFGLNARAADTNSASARQYCTPSSGMTLFLDDRTTKYDATDSKDLDDGLYATIMGLKVGERIVIRTITDDPFASERVFDGCRPGCPHTAWSWATCNDLAMRREINEFYRSAAGSLKALRTTSEDHHCSAIFETLAVLGNEYRDVPLRRVIVFSDLLENTKQLPTSLILRARPKLALQRLHKLNFASRFSGADILVFGTGRLDDQTRRGLTIAEWQDLQTIWTEWFKEAGAASVRIYQWYPNPR